MVERKERARIREDVSFGCVPFENDISGLTAMPTAIPKESEARELAGEDRPTDRPAANRVRGAPSLVPNHPLSYLSILQISNRNR